MRGTLFEIEIDGVNYFVTVHIDLRLIGNKTVCGKCKGKRQTDENTYLRTFEIVQIEDEDQFIIPKRRSEIFDQARRQLLQKEYFQPICENCLSRQQCEESEEWNEFMDFGLLI